MCWKILLSIRIRLLPTHNPQLHIQLPYSSLGQLWISYVFYWNTLLMLQKKSCDGTRVLHVIHLMPECPVLYNQSCVFVWLWYNVLMWFMICPEDVVHRYRAVLKEFRRTRSMSLSCITLDVDRNTIVLTAIIAKIVIAAEGENQCSRRRTL